MRLGRLVLLSTNPGPGMGMVPSEWPATAGLHLGQSHVTSLAGGAPEDGRRVYTEALSARVSSQCGCAFIDVRSIDLGWHGIDLRWGDPFIPHPSFPPIISK